MQQSAYVSVSGTARMLAKSENTIRLWERQGKLTAIKTENGTRVFARAEVERLATEQEMRKVEEQREARG